MSGGGTDPVAGHWRMFYDELANWAGVVKLVDARDSKGTAPKPVKFKRFRELSVPVPT